MSIQHDAPSPFQPLDFGIPGTMLADLGSKTLGPRVRDNIPEIHGDRAALGETLQGQKSKTNEKQQPLSTLSKRFTQKVKNWL